MTVRHRPSCLGPRRARSPARRTRRRPRRGPSAWTTSTPAPPPPSSSPWTGWCWSRCRSRAAGSRRRRHQPRQVPLRGPRPGHQPAPLLARLRLHLRRVGDHRRRPAPPPAPSPSRSASRAPAAPVQVVVKKRARRPDLPRGLVAARSTRPTRRWTTRRPPSPGPARRAPAERPAGGEARPAAGRRRLHRGPARPLRGRRPAAHRGALRPRALEVAGAATSTSGGSARPPSSRASRAPPPASTGAAGSASPTTPSAPSATCSAFENRSLRDVAVLRPLRRAGHRGQRRDLRRRRHLRPLRHGGGRLEVGRVHLRPRAGPLGGRRWPTSTSPATPVYTPAAERPELWEPNVTADPKAPKWADLLDPKLARPSPWPRGEVHPRGARGPGAAQGHPGPQRPGARRWTRSSRASRQAETALLSPLNGPVGAFEGANYEATGYYRPQADCVMFTRDEVPFCAVCQRALSRVIDLYAAPPAR